MRVNGQRQTPAPLPPAEIPVPIIRGGSLGSIATLDGYEEDKASCFHGSPNFGRSTS